MDKHSHHTTWDGFPFKLYRIPVGQFPEVHTDRITGGQVLIDMLMDTGVSTEYLQKRVYLQDSRSTSSQRVEELRVLYRGQQNVIDMLKAHACRTTDPQETMAKIDDLQANSLRLKRQMEDLTKVKHAVATGYPLRVLNTSTCELEVPTNWDFKCLSYRWLNVSKWTFDTIFEGKPFVQDVTAFDKPNFCRLIKLFALNGIKRVWIDALCIRQDDLIEKGKEMKKMARMYNNTETIVLPWGVGKCWNYPVNDEGIAPWFRRVWTLQEALLSPKLYFVVESTSGSPFLDREYVRAQVNVNFELCTKVNSILDEEYRIAHKDPTAMTSAMKYFNQGINNVPPTVMDVCGMLSCRGCTKEQDKIYGSMGILGIETMDVQYDDKTLKQCVIEWYTQLDQDTQTWLTLRETYNEQLGVMPSFGSGVINNIIKWKKFIGHVVRTFDLLVAIEGHVTDINDVTFFETCDECEPLYPSWKYAYMDGKKCIMSVARSSSKYRVVWIAQRDNSYVGIIVATHGNMVYQKYGLVCIESMCEPNIETIYISA